MAKLFMFAVLHGSIALIGLVVGVVYHGFVIGFHASTELGNWLTND
jgi:hypothetical protein